MAKITLKFENKLQQSVIVIPFVTAGEGEMEDNPIGTQNTDVKQNLLYGIRVPLVKVNDIVIDADSILYMELDGSGPLPTLELTFIDHTYKIKGLQQPGNDNEVRLQILPRMEKAYKKIDMTFYISSVSESGGVMSLSCIYKVLELYNNHIKCFGQISSYEVFEQLAHECKLGFASNVAGSNDKRYLYAPNISYNKFMSNIINSSGDSGNDINSKILYDYWIDFWNNINFADIYERFNAVDSDDDIQIYVPRYDFTIIDEADKDIYIKTTAVLSNHPFYVDSELYIDSYNVVNNSPIISKGSSRIISIYDMIGGESKDYLLENKDQLKDLVTVAQYGGENYEEFNYLLAGECRDFMRNKMTEETIEVTVHGPLLSLMRGSKVNLKWFDVSDELHRTKQQLGIKGDSIKSNIPLETSEENDNDSTHQLHINAQVSGQYYILSSTIIFENNTWSNRLRLTRPKINKMKYIDLSEVTEQINRN